MVRLSALAALLSLTACDINIAPPPTSTELSEGLVVLYAGASSTSIEMQFIYQGLKDAGLTRAIQPIPWATPWSNVINAIDYERHKQWAVTEAHRLTKYLDDHPGGAVTLIGYSAGAGAAALTAAAMPADHPIDRIIFLSADLSPDFDLRPSLDRTQRGAINYFSPLDLGVIDLVTQLGTFDRVFIIPAAVIGFNLDDPRLLQVRWHVAMGNYGNFGGHFDFLFNPTWVAHYVAPWVTEDLDVVARQIIDESGNQPDPPDDDTPLPPNTVP